MTIDFVLDEIDPNVSGIWMEGLISLWFEKGLSFDQFDTLYRVGVLTEALDTHFIQSLMPSDDEFLQQMPSIINSLEFWEEIPAWHEVCLLKRLFQSSTDQHVFARSFEPLLKRNLIIITQILPADAARRPKHDPPVHDDGKLIRLDQEPLWYRERFSAYSQRHLDGEARRLRTSEISLRYIFARKLKTITHFCSDPLLDFVEEHVASSVEFGHEETTPGGQCIYPSEWLDVINSWVMRLNQKGNISASSLNCNWVACLDEMS
ncbi:hypothetical protein FOXG_21638 [Fusarium oxysporum f. sp. lycopersici 4287]|nr:hypothetical protein FOXG_21638 [Fusarium oxysporum f. sp. lycopersici 4287]KAJ4034134.1 hypothetical protein NW758_011092 [Fusarium oxysporum]KAJ4077771.1 hypothetical protein NW761_012089 [Fusarium oxysporum]KAJ9414902.1 hypothetical protein QL093DRAFT_2449709 [Fusarium oxysporum]KNB16357.1 hypothetical protein FOXG_21638 [Fusarium oxysporum f. sp. lycopersici 4287]